MRESSLLPRSYIDSLLRLGQTDDVGFFCSPVSQEYFLASKHFGLDRGDLVALCDRGVGSIFGGDEEKARIRRLLTDFSKVNA